MNFKTNFSGRDWLAILLLLQTFLFFFLPDAEAAAQKLLRMMKVQSIPAFSAGMQEETEHFQVEYLQLDQKDVEMVCTSAETALEALAAAGFSYRGEEKIQIKIYPDTESLAESFGWEKDEQAMGAYSKGMIGILAPTAWMGEEKTQQRFDREGPLLHELTHLLVDEMTEGNYNRWWTEGVAQYMEKKIYHFQMAAPVSVENFYSLEEMEQNFDRLKQRQVYWQSLQAIEYITENYSETALQSIMQEAARNKNFDRGFTAVLNQDIMEFERKYENDMKLKWGTGCNVEKQPITH